MPSDLGKSTKHTRHLHTSLAQTLPRNRLKKKKKKLVRNITVWTSAATASIQSSPFLLPFYSFLAVLSLRCCTGFSLVAASGDYSCSAQPSY